MVNVTNYGKVTTLGCFFIDMELCDFDLEEYISGRLTTPESKNLSEYSLTNGAWNYWDIMEQISNGLKFIHERELVHRDLKPSNSISESSVPVSNMIVLFSRKDGCWKITDFGFTTKGTSTHAEPCPDANGSIGYRAPEIIQKGSLTNKVDIWALGCTLFEVAKGKKVFKSDFDVREYGVSRSPIIILKSLLPNDENEKELCNFLKRMLNVDASERPPADALWLEFTEILWLSIGDELRKRGKPDASVLAYEKGLKAHRTCGPLCDLVSNAKTKKYENLKQEQVREKRNREGLETQLKNARDSDSKSKREINSLRSAHFIELSTRDKTHKAALDDFRKSLETNSISQRLMASKLKNGMQSSAQFLHWKKNTVRESYLSSQMYAIKYRRLFRLTQRPSVNFNKTKPQ